MNKVAENLFQSREVTDADGNKYPLHSETSLAQCEFLQTLIKDVDAETCLEIGLGYGLSSMFIAEAISVKQAPKLISIDPFQDAWHDIGLLNLERAGHLRFVDFYREPSSVVLPRLLSAGQKIDFAYIDTTKIFDLVMIDAFYVTQILRVGGVMVFDDCSLSGLRRLVRYLAKLPYLKVAAIHNPYQISTKRRFFSKIIRSLPRANNLFDDMMYDTDPRLGINAQCVAFRKIGEDTRNWDWSCNF